MERPEAGPFTAVHEGAQARAGGKVLLLGEHAVVYGAAALGAAVRLGVRATVVPSGGRPSTLQLLGRIVTADARAADPTSRAWSTLCGLAPAAAVDARLVGELPAGVGLGFSAAAGVALARGVELTLGDPPDEARVRARAMAWEQVFHGNPSGVDVEVAMADGMIHFSKRAGARRVRCPSGLVLCIGLSGTTGSTSRMVAAVAALRERAPALVDDVVAAIDERVARAEQALGRSDAPRLGALLDEGHALLGRLGVSTPALDELCAVARSAGALGAKLTGSGGGGAVIALAGLQEPEGAVSPAVRAVVDRIVSSWRAAGFDAFETGVGGSGRAG
jgi:mevalonate kinase